MSQTALAEFAAPEKIERPAVVEREPEPATPTAYQCQSCGSPVSADYVRVMCPDGSAGPETCPHCNREGVSR